MKTKKRKNSLKEITHWVGFALCACIVIGATAYGFSLSLRPNSLTLNSAPEIPIAIVGVAMSNNVGTGIAKETQAPVKLAQDVIPAQEAVIRDGFGGEVFFREHFNRLATFTEIINIDLVQYLRVHPDRITALDDYIAELEEAKEDAKTAQMSVQQLHDFHTSALEGSTEDIKSKQSLIENAYKNRDGDAIMQAIAELEETNIASNEHKNIALFAQKITSEYAQLIAGAEKKLTVINANKPAIVQGITVNLPTGANLSQLKELKIFATE